MNKKTKDGLADLLKGGLVALLVVFATIGAAGMVQKFTKNDIELKGQNKHCSRQSDRALWKVDADCLYYFLEYRKSE